MMDTLKIIVSTGGTGGHIFPALAVADEIKRKYPNAEVLFAGSLYGKEKELCRKHGLDFYGLNVRGIKGRGLKAISALFAMSKAILESCRFLKKYKPHAVIGFGGYACFAMLLAAKLRGVPTMIHEQNAVAGLANAILAKLADTVCLSLPDTQKQFNPEKCVLTGNPIRHEIANVKKENKDYTELLVMGGSLGAVAINSLAVQLLGTLRDNNIHIIHQCGEKDYARVAEAYKSHGYSQAEIDTMLFPFIDNMAEAYAKADFALCRAGATSIAELAATKTPALFIPFPYAANDHQTANAQSIVSRSGAIMVKESDIKQYPMDKIILSILQSKAELSEMAENIGKSAQKNAAENVVAELDNLLQKKRQS
ncbi:MAG TPA: undecaprenyldiphospho-muramoylpentapeptide beta-N-acetylglucosaminyltransferase [Desulfovibrio sp.]|nr:undecaprenyldiphospho-muramoylpentapeptide beta-N-acetylglucosaminyltransferase [Desulfovibrio sp.]